MKTLLLAALVSVALTACTTTPSRLTPDQSARLASAKVDCQKASNFPKVHPAASRNQSGVRTQVYYDCMRDKGFVEVW